jgi:ribonuclease J
MELTGELLFVPLGGIGEIGKNFYLYGYEGNWLAVDCGITFGDDTTPGIDTILPDPAFAAEHREDLLGIVVTHAHEDHIGAIHLLWPRLRCPVYVTPFAASVLERKLGEVGLNGTVPVHLMRPGDRLKLGPFEVEPVHVTHSIPESTALALRTPAGTVFHSGDWKLDPEPVIGAPTDAARLREIGEAGVAVMVCDSTNVLEEGAAGSEAEVREGLRQLIGELDGRRVTVTCFSSNVARIDSIARAAAANDRSVVLVGRSLRTMTTAAMQNGMLEDLPPFLDESDAAELPPERTVLIATGSQGEARAALTRIAFGEHRHVDIGPDDVVVYSSRVIPGNELAIHRQQNALMRRGVHVITEHDRHVHVSGHPARGELRQMYEWIRPRFVVPMHGETRHIYEHVDFAREQGVEAAFAIENGQMLRLAPGVPEVVDHVTVGRMVLENDELVSLDDGGLRQRKQIIFNGAAVASLVLDRTGKLAGAPRVTIQGLLDTALARATTVEAERAVEQVVAALPKQARDNDEVIEEAARVAVRRAFRDRMDVKPVTTVQVLRLDSA